VVGTGCPQQAATQVTYGYYYEGELITLTPSARMVALSESGSAFRDFANAQGLERDPLSDHPALRGRELGLYRLPSTSDIDLAAEMAEFAQASPEEIQPVFEQGSSLLIPSDEIIVRFEESVSLEEAREYFAPHETSQGIVDIREHRRGSYILRIDNAGSGRVYAVCQFIATLDGVASAEPNHTIVHLIGSGTVPVDRQSTRPQEHI
jgi:hypothetical protein